MVDSQVGQKSRSDSTATAHPAQCAGKKSVRRGSSRAGDTAEVYPNQNAGCEKNQGGNKSCRHSAAYHIRPDPWQEGIWWLGTELRHELEGLLTKNPAGMQSHGDKKGARVERSVSEKDSSNQQGKKTPAEERPWRCAGKCQWQLLKAAEPPHGSLHRLSRGSHEMDERKQSR